MKSDNPIKTVDEDKFERTPVANSFAEQVLRIDASEGLVIGVLGPWGSGKTSFLNLAEKRFSERASAVVEFNPWMFSGTEQLVDSFFIEISSQLKRKGLKDPKLVVIADRLENYGEVFAGLGWLPVVGTWIERGRGVSKVLSNVLKERKKGTADKRDSLREGLLELERPIVVTIDDIDRLSTQEIRDIFKLVRLTASFPNIIYVLAFDRQ